VTILDVVATLFTVILLLLLLVVLLQILLFNDLWLTRFSFDDWCNWWSWWFVNTWCDKCLSECEDIFTSLFAVLLLLPLFIRLTADTVWLLLPLLTLELGWLLVTIICWLSLCLFDVEFKWLLLLCAVSDTPIWLLTFKLFKLLLLLLLVELLFELEEFIELSVEDKFCLIEFWWFDKFMVCCWDVVGMTWKCSESMGFCCCCCCCVFASYNWSRLFLLSVHRGYNCGFQL
jgi:hypothetical protein